MNRTKRERQYLTLSGAKTLKELGLMDDNEASISCGCLAGRIVWKILSFIFVFKGAEGV